MVKMLHNDKSVRFLSLDWKGKAMHSTHHSVHPVIRIRLATFDWTLKAKSGSGSLCQRSGAFQNTVQLIVLFMVIRFCRKNPPELITLSNLPVLPTSWAHVLFLTWLLLHDFGNLLPKNTAPAQELSLSSPKCKPRFAQTQLSGMKHFP